MRTLHRWNYVESANNNDNRIGGMISPKNTSTKGAAMGTACQSESGIPSYLKPRGHWMIWRWNFTLDNFQTFVKKSVAGKAWVLFKPQDFCGFGCLDNW